MLSRIDAAGAKRHTLAPELTHLIRELQVAGALVPQKLRKLERVLHDEAVEDEMDNLPI